MRTLADSSSSPSVSPAFLLTAAHSCILDFLQLRNDRGRCNVSTSELGNRASGERAEFGSGVLRAWLNRAYS